ncbi:MAG: endonuclease/exonuclease/phosphatase family protein [Bacteroidota bacterium]
MTDAPPTGRPARRRQRVLRALLAIAEVPVVAAVLVGYAAAFLPPRPYWWAQLAAVGLPYATWALAITGVAWLVARHWPAVAFHTLLVGLVLLRAGALDRFGDRQPAADDLVLTTFNVPEVGPSRETLGDEMATYVREAEPDLLALQDAWVQGDAGGREGRRQAVQVEAVTTALPYTLELPERLAGHPGWRENETGVPVLVRDDAGIEVVEQEALVLGVERDPDVSLALRTHLRWRDREAVLYNVHLRSFGEAKPWEDDRFSLFRISTWRPYARRYRAVYGQRGDEVEEIAERIEAETLPVIVAGDLNSTADNWSYRRLRTAGGVDRVDAFRQAGGWAWGRTYHARRPFVRIDVILADPALNVTSARTTPVTFSDHRPVQATLRWRASDPAPAGNDVPADAQAPAGTQTSADDRPPAGGSSGRIGVNPASQSLQAQTAGALAR